MRRSTLATCCVLTLVGCSSEHGSGSASSTGTSAIASGARPAAAPEVPERSLAPTPDGPFEADPSPDPVGLPATTVVVLSRDPSGRVTLVDHADAPVRFVDRQPDAALGRFRLEDASTGAVLAEGRCPLPPPSRSGRVELEGDMLLSRDRVFQITLPRLAATERLRIYEVSGSNLIELARVEVKS